MHPMAAAMTAVAMVLAAVVAAAAAAAQAEVRWEVAYLTVEPLGLAQKARTWRYHLCLSTRVLCSAV